MKELKGPLRILTTISKIILIVVYLKCFEEEEKSALIMRLVYKDFDYISVLIDQEVEIFNETVKIKLVTITETKNLTIEKSITKSCNL